jgi:hypothetical protein
MMLEPGKFGVKLSQDVAGFTDTDLTAGKNTSQANACQLSERGLL